MSSKTLPTGKVTRAELWRLRRSGWTPQGKGCISSRCVCGTSEVVQRRLAVMFSFVFPLSQLLLRWKELLVPMRNFTKGKRDRQAGSQLKQQGWDIGSESEEQKAPRRNKCCNCVAGAWKEAFGSWRQDSIQWRRVNVRRETEVPVWVWKEAVLWEAFHHYVSALTAFNLRSLSPPASEFRRKGRRLLPTP